MVVYVSLFGLGFCSSFLTFPWSQLQEIYYSNKMKTRNGKSRLLCFLFCVFIPLRNFIVFTSTDERGTNPVLFCLKLALGLYGSGKQRQMLRSCHQRWCSAAETSFTFFLVKHLLSNSSRSANFPVTQDNPVDKVDKSPPLPVTYLLLRGCRWLITKNVS